MLAPALFAGLSRATPALAARVALWMFCRPPRPRAPGLGWGSTALRSADGEVVVHQRTVSPVGGSVLFVHGWGGSAGDWAAMADRIMGQARRQVALDMPAHGRSAGRRSSLPRFVRALASVTERLGRFDVWVAHSGGAGAAVAAIAALPVDVRPDRLVLVAPLSSAATAIDGFLRAMRLSDSARSRFVRLLETRERMPIARLDAVAAARALAVETLIVHDADDRVVPHSEGARLAQALSAGLVTTRGLGHRRILSAPSTLEVVAGFVTRGAVPR